MLFVQVSVSDASAIRTSAVLVAGGNRLAWALLIKFRRSLSVSSCSGSSRILFRLATISHIY